MNSPYVISVDECWRKEVFNSRTLEDALKIFENLTQIWWSLCKESMIGVKGKCNNHMKDELYLPKVEESLMISLGSLEIEREW